MIWPTRSPAFARVCVCVFERMRGRFSLLLSSTLAVVCCLLVLMIINESLALLRFRLFFEWGAILVSFHLSLFSSSSSFSSYYYHHHHHHLISLSPCSIEDESSLVNCVMSLKWDGARRWNCYFIKRPTRDSIRDFPENYSTFFFFVSFVRS